MVIFFDISGRIVRDMITVAHQKLQRVRAGRQVDVCFGLAQAEVQVVLVVSGSADPAAAAAVSISK